MKSYNFGRNPLSALGLEAQFQFENFNFTDYDIVENSNLRMSIFEIQKKLSLAIYGYQTQRFLFISSDQISRLRTTITNKSAKLADRL